MVFVIPRLREGSNKTYYFTPDKFRAPSAPSSLVLYLRITGLAARFSTSRAMSSSTVSPMIP